ncbi:MAG: hypothetical protein RIC35_01585 [Marinoscillum sp.]
MEFEIKRKENYVVTPWDEVGPVGLVAVFGYIVLSPLYLLKFLKQKLLKKQIASQSPKWSVISSSEDITIYWSMSGIPNLVQLLEYPKDVKQINAYKIKSMPECKALDEKLFYSNAAQIKDGLFLMSYNKYEKGMSLWFLHFKKRELSLVQNLESYEWAMKTTSHTSISLNAEDYKPDGHRKLSFTYLVSLKNG